MKVTKVYTCEKCGRQYKSEEDCKKCEEYHTGCDKIIKESYYQMEYSTYPYPFDIDILMKDGTVVKYKKDEIGLR